MTARAPKLSSDAGEQARAVHAFLIAHGLTMRGWSARAGLSSNVLSELFAGRTRSVTHDTLARLARAAGVAPGDIVPSAGIGQVRLDQVERAVIAWAEARGEDCPKEIAQDIMSRLLKS